MNITRNRNYNQQALGLRQPSTILDQQKKLVFIYPVLCTNHLSKYKDTIRQFYSINTLKEIFISNTLNLVSLTSQISDEHNSNNVSNTIGNVVLSLSGTSSNMTSLNPTNQRDKYALENKINQKMTRIKKYLETDPQLKALQPHIDFITLENLIDVPVIVGTKDFGTDTFATLLVLTTAVALGRPLNSDNNLKIIMAALKEATTKSGGTNINNLLNNLVQAQTTRAERLDSWLANKPRLRNIRSKINTRFPRVARFVGLQSRQNQREAEEERNRTQGLQPGGAPAPYAFNPETAFQILRFTDPEFNQINVFFKLMLNKTAFYSQTGLQPDSGQISGVIKTMNHNFTEIAHTTHTQFINLVATMGTPILRSVSNLLFPSPSSPTFDFLRVKDEHIDTYLNNQMLKVLNDDIIYSLKTSLEELDPATATQQIKLVKSICRNLDQTDAIVSDNFKNLTNESGYSRYDGISNQNYDMDRVASFLTAIDKLSNTLNSFNKSFQMTFSRLVPNANQVLERARSQIYNSVDNFLRAYSSEYSNAPMNNVLPHVSTIGANVNNRMHIDLNTVQTRLIPQLNDALYTIFYFFLLYRIQAAVCQMVDVLEIEVETASKDVLEWPNYIMIIPIEFISFLHTVIIAKTWNTLTTNPNFQSNMNPPVTDGNIKNIVKFVSKRLNIPNLVVIDEAKGKVYYKFMYMSQVNNTTLSNIENFIRQNS